jgi:hypothetical protein
MGGRSAYLPPMSVLLPIPDLRRTVLLPLLMCSGWLVGCASSPAPALLREEPREVAWSPERVRQHIQTLDGPEMEGRQTAARGFVRAANYVAGRLRNMGLQPVLQREYRMQYAARISRANRMDMRVIDQDTVQWMPGKEFLLIDVPSGWQAAGRGGPVAGNDFMVFQDEVASNWTENVQWRFDVRVQEDATTAPMHVVGMLPGADPVQRDSLVVLMAPMDGYGLQRVQSWTDGRDVSIPAAALLEATRRLATLQRQWAFLPYSVLVVFVSGTVDACQGVDSLVRHFPWDTNAIKAVHILRMEADTRCHWRDGWPPAVPVSHWTAYTPFSPDGTFGFGPWRPRSEMLDVDALDAAVAEAMRVAQGVMEAVR